jgi:hypothetical protein
MRAYRGDDGHRIDDGGNSDDDINGHVDINCVHSTACGSDIKQMQRAHDSRISQCVKDAGKQRIVVLPHTRMAVLRELEQHAQGPPSNSCVGVSHASVRKLEQSRQSA